MKLTTKFNLVLILVFSISLLATGYFTQRIVRDSAKEEIVQHAGMMMEAAIAMRSYTVNEIRPLLAHKLKKTFLPQTVPAYAATQAFEKLRERHPEYSYKEATLNPTNPRDRAADWEADIISLFKNQSDKKEFIGVRETPSGKILYLARPIRITNAGCLTCHSTTKAAPKSLLAKYGEANGFGWQMNEVVGAQIVTVPMTVTIEKAKKVFKTFMGAMGAIFVVVMILLTIMLRTVIIKPITKMAKVADEVSLGNMEAPEFDSERKDEIGTLAASFTRMRRSLGKAMTMIDD